jgi:hypothetical protein
MINLIIKFFRGDCDEYFVWNARTRVNSNELFDKCSSLTKVLKPDEGAQA